MTRAGNPGDWWKAVTFEQKEFNRKQEVRVMKRSGGFVFPALLLTLLAFMPNSAAGQYTVVASGLQGPRGLAFGPGGRLYVTQTGTGENGKITEIQNPFSSSPSTRDLVTGLVAAGPEGERVGPAAISALG